MLDLATSSSSVRHWQINDDYSVTESRSGSTYYFACLRRNCQLRLLCAPYFYCIVTLQLETTTIGLVVVVVCVYD